MSAAGWNVFFFPTSDYYCNTDIEATLRGAFRDFRWTRIETAVGVPDANERFDRENFRKYRRAGFYRVRRVRWTVVVSIRSSRECRAPTTEAKGNFFSRGTLIPDAESGGKPWATRASGFREIARIAIATATSRPT